MELISKIENYYRNSNSEKTLLWNDPEIKIKWPIKNPILYKKDKLANLTLKDLK